MSERLTFRLDDPSLARLSDVAQARGVDVSTLLREAVTSYLDGTSRTGPTATPPGSLLPPASDQSREDSGARGSRILYVVLARVVKALEARETALADPALWNLVETLAQLLAAWPRAEGERERYNHAWLPPSNAPGGQ